MRGTVGLIPKGRRVGLYIIAAGLWLTGVVWLIFHYFISGIDEFGFPTVSPLQHWLLVGHAIFSFFAVWMFGVMWPIHIKIGWAARIRRLSGGALFAATVILCASGLLLYYVQGDISRTYLSIVHWSVGLGALGAFLIHVWARRRRSGAYRSEGRS